MSLRVDMLESTFNNFEDFDMNEKRHKRCIIYCTNLLNEQYVIFCEKNG